MFLFDSVARWKRKKMFLHYNIITCFSDSVACEFWNSLFCHDFANHRQIKVIFFQDLKKDEWDRNRFWLPFIHVRKKWKALYEAAYKKIQDWQATNRVKGTDEKCLHAGWLLYEKVQIPYKGTDFQVLEGSRWFHSVGYKPKLNESKITNAFG